MRVSPILVETGPDPKVRTRRADEPLRRLAFLLMCGGLGLSASGCSLSMPIAGFIPDPTVTGSIDRPDAVVFESLDQEDGRRARAALAVALDPQGNGESVAWANPQSGAKGSFAAAAAPYSHNSRVCRAFKASIKAGTRERAVNGRACRDTDGDWSIAEARQEERGAADKDSDAGKLKS